MAHTFIKDISPGNTVDDIYLIKSPVLRSTTKGDLYIAMYLLDKSGQVNSRMWQATEETYKALPQNGFVHIAGRSEQYQNNLQIIVNSISIVDSSKVTLEDFLARTEKDTSKMFEELKAMVGKIKNRQLRMIAAEFFADEVLMEKFRQAPAGVKLHHNYLGGLLEHTHNMMRMAVAILGFFPKVQSDLVLAGILLHDLGKTQELSYDMALSYTDSGQLIGHITKTLLMLHRKTDALARKGKVIDETVLDSLGHIILSHHGQYEFGSPVLPATAEAFMVNYLDDLDAKLNQVTGAVEQEKSDKNWTQWQNSLQRRLYRGRIE